MYHYKVLVVLFLYGFSHVNSFFHFQLNEFIFHNYPGSLNESSLQSDPTNWIEQPVDHFNSSDQRTWKMKYYRMSDYWKPGGPIILWINGESALDIRSLLVTYVDGGSTIKQLIQDTGAVYFMSEHRYYGSSRPFIDTSVENLVFLTSRQALADVAYLLQTIKACDDFKNSKVIVIGGSYAGSLATWMKVLYPDLINAVLASSAPVLAKKDFYEFMETVTETFATYGSQDCVNRITNRFNYIYELLETPEGIEQIKQKERICENVDMTIPKNQQLLFFTLSYEYATLSQYGTPTNISAVCDTKNLDSLEMWNNILDCRDLEFDKYVKLFSLTGRLWLYQSCTEFGYFQSTTTKNMFGNTIPVNFYYNMCSLLFGNEFNEQRVDKGVERTNKMYGGLTPNVDHVVFVNGDMDPWHRLGITQDLSLDNPSIYIQGSSHCHVFRPETVNDNENVKEARKRIKDILEHWINP